jgi:23S rRNA (guanosine2251-2'-O)-methyltransferase
MMLYGFHSVIARIKRAPQSIKELYLANERLDARGRDLLKLAKDAGVRVLQVESNRIERLGAGHRHQGVVAVVEADVLLQTLEDLLDSIDASGKPALLLILDGVTDPRNLGACLRVADGAGAQAVIAPKDHSCMLTDTAISTASGAAESVPYIQVTNLARALDDIQERRIWVMGTDDEAPRTLYEETLSTSVAWVLGAEGSGMRRLTKERCDTLVRIPMGGKCESLNVSVAAGVVLYESVRQMSLLKK